jgi:hypothetical protein
MSDPSPPRARTFWLAAIALILLAGAVVHGILAAQQWHGLQGMVSAGRRQATALEAQLAALRQANTINHEGLVASNRAYVAFRGLNLSGSINGADPSASRFAINPVWENVGNTPTRDMQIYTNPAKEIKHPLLDMSMPKTPNIAPGMLAPHTTGMGSSTYVTGDQLLAIRDGRLRMYMWGWARYRDVFAGTPMRQSRFCILINTFQGDPNVPGEASVSGSPCGQYGDNYECSDQECGPQQ